MAKYTTKQIIKQFKDRHGDTFDYSLVDYQGTAIKVTIICRKHGAFDQLAGAHKRGQGCAKCMYDGKRKSADEAISSFKDKHGDRYDYSLVKYKNVDEKVKIICAEHGVFLQTPYLHTNGSGCPKCIGRHKTQDEVIELFKLAHGDRYDYSQVIFDKVGGKVDIICHEHGVFSQTVTNHVAGQGCIKCAGIYQYTTSEIIDKFKTIHGSTYDYSLVKYVNQRAKVKIICKRHGIFEQLPYSHFGGCGCPDCGSNYQPTTDEVVEQFNSIHLGRYDYSKVDYVNADTVVDIVCELHGVFKQTPRHHKRGNGCSDCAVTIGHTKNSYLNYCSQFDSKTNLYLIRCYCDDTSESFYKVGIARQGADNRFDSRRKLPYSYEVLKEVNGDAGLMWDLEDAVHRLLQPYKHKPLKDFHGKTECFTHITKEAIDLIDNYRTVGYSDEKQTQEAVL